jgi:hypothetical protein
MTTFDTWKQGRIIREFKEKGGRLIKAIIDDMGTVRPAFCNRKFVSRYMATGDEFTQSDYDKWTSKMERIIVGIDYTRGWHDSERRSAPEINSLKEENRLLKLRLEELNQRDIA